MQALMTPEKTAMPNPFAKWNSRTVFRFSSSESSFSFDIPAQPLTPMPRRHMDTPDRIQ